MHKTSNTQPVTNVWFHKHRVLRNPLQEGVHKEESRKTTTKTPFFFFFFYLAFVEVVDDFLVELFLQLTLCCRLVPVPLGQVGRTHILRPLRQKQSMTRVR